MIGGIRQADDDDDDADDDVTGGCCVGAASWQQCMGRRGGGALDVGGLSSDLEHNSIVLRTSAAARRVPQSVCRSVCVCAVCWWIVNKWTETNKWMWVKTCNRRINRQR